MKRLKTRRGSKGAFNAPSFSESFNESVLFKPDSAGPLSHGHGFSIECDPCVASSVVVLFKHRRPPTIFRRIPNRIVNSVKRQTVWALSHVSQEVVKYKPSVRYGDSTPPIVLIILVTRIKTALLHCRPRLIGRSLCSSRSMPVPRQTNFVLAMANFHVSSTYLRNKSLSLLPTKIAFEESLHISVEIDGVSKKCKAPEPSSGLYIFVFWHSSHSDIIREVGHPSNGYGQRENDMDRLKTAYESAGGTYA